VKEYGFVTWPFLEEEASTDLTVVSGGTQEMPFMISFDDFEAVAA